MVVTRVGRWHFGIKSPSTIYGEQDIKNVEETLKKIKEIESITLELDGTSINLLTYKKSLHIVEKIEKTPQLSQNFIENKLFEVRETFLVKLFDKFLKMLVKYPTNQKLHEAFMFTAEKIKKPQSELAYKKVLELYQANPDDVAVKQFVLKVGRWHFGKQRFWDRPNAHDEQTIQTDILVRSR